MNNNMFPILILAGILSLAMIIGMLVFFAGRRKDKGGKLFSVLIGIVALLAGVAMEIDTVMTAALVGIVAVLIYMDFKRSQRKKSDADSEEI